MFTNISSSLHLAGIWSAFCINFILFRKIIRKLWCVHMQTNEMMGCRCFQLKKMHFFSKVLISYGVWPENGTLQKYVRKMRPWFFATFLRQEAATSKTHFCCLSHTKVPFVWSKHDITMSGQETHKNLSHESPLQKNAVEVFLH